MELTRPGRHSWLDPTAIEPKILQYYFYTTLQSTIDVAVLRGRCTTQTEPYNGMLPTLPCATQELGRDHVTEVRPSDGESTQALGIRRCSKAELLRRQYFGGVTANEELVIQLLADCASFWMTE